MTDSIALVTGSSRGLGRSMAEALARRGHRVVVTYRERGDEAAAVVQGIADAGGQAIALPLDVAAHDTFLAFVDALRKAIRDAWNADGLDVLVNNAGHGVHAPIADTGAAQLDALFDVHLKGPFLLTQALLPVLRDGGHVVNVSSGLARFSYPGYAAYAAMKGAIEVFTRYLAAELGPRRIRANVLAPGAIATDFGGGAVRDNANLNAMIASSTALGRVGEADDIGPLVAALVSQDMRWVNGQRIEAAGGIHL